MTNARLEIGGIRITALVDARPAPVEPAYAYPEVAAEAWAGLEAGVLDGDGRYAPNLGCFLIELPDANVLVDCGIGPGPLGYLGDLRGCLPALLHEAGVRPEAIDLVLFTHLHMDHVGWAMSAGAGGEVLPTFASARHVAIEGERDFWLARPEAGAHHITAIDRAIRPLVEAGRLETVQPGAVVGHGLSFLATPGHTPNHASVRLDTPAGALVVTGDVLHCPAQVQRPAWCHRADMDKERARATRRGLIEQAAAEEWTLAAGHFQDGWQLGRIESAGSGHRWRRA